MARKSPTHFARADEKLCGPGRDRSTSSERSKTSACSETISRHNGQSETAPADISVQIYSPGKIVSDESGLVATIRRTLGQGVAALMWSVRMIGVAIAFLAPWILALRLLGWLVTHFAKRRSR